MLFLLIRAEGLLHAEAFGGVMKIYGYANEGQPVEEIEPKELAEITLVARPEELRTMASFLAAAADAMERMRDDYSHEHLADKYPEFAASPHFVVSNALFDEL
jgi:hypothetical protein